MSLVDELINHLLQRVFLGQLINVKIWNVVVSLQCLLLHYLTVCLILHQLLKMLNIILKFILLFFLQYLICFIFIFVNVLLFICNFILIIHSFSAKIFLKLSTFHFTSAIKGALMIAAFILGIIKYFSSRCVIFAVKL